MKRLTIERQAFFIQFSFLCIGFSRSIENIALPIRLSIPEKLFQERQCIDALPLF